METENINTTYQPEIDQIVADLFQSMLATEAVPAENYVRRGEDVITAFVVFAGSWKGDLVLECHRPQAHSFAKRFLQCDDLEDSGEETSSSIAEFANIIAGNLKVVLPPGVSMGTPSIIEGKDYTVKVCGGKIICHRAFTTDVGPFLLRLIENPMQTGGEG